MPLPHRIGRGPYFEVREISCAGQHIEGYLAFLNSTLQIVHHQYRLIHVLHIELCLRPHYLQTQVEPDVFGNVDFTGETLPVIDLPIGSGVEYRRVLQCVWIAGLMWPKANPFTVGTVSVEPKLYTDKPAAPGGCDIH